MVDGQTRRTLKRNVNVANTDGEPVSISDSGTVSSVQREPGTESDVNRSADTHDRNAHNEPNSVERIGVVEVNPEQLGEFIAERAAERDDSGTGNGNNTRKRRSDSGVKRGRKSRKEAPQNIDAVVSMIHTWASVLLKTPELMLEESEVKQLSEAYNTFSEYHEVPLITPKRMSEVNLVCVALVIYGSRVVAIRNRHKQERTKGNVTQMPNRATVGH